MGESGDATRSRLVRGECAGPVVESASVPRDRAGDDGVTLGVRGCDPLGPVRRRLDPGGKLGVVAAGARMNVDGACLQLAAEFGEPGAVLGDEVECEAVAPRWDRRSHLCLDDRALAGCERWKRCALAVPHDRVVALVEPVIGELDARAPADRAGVLDLDLGSSVCAGLRLGERRVAEADDKRPLCHGRLV